MVGAVAMTGLATPASLRAQDAELEPASRAYAELRLDDAWAEIQRVLTALEGPEADAVPRDTRLRAYVLGASIARARGDLGASDAALDRALELDAMLVLDPALHPPPLLEALERRRAARAARSEAETHERSGVDDAESRGAPVEADARGAPVEADARDAPVDRAGALRVVAPPLLVGTSGRAGGEDPWPWVGLGIGGAVVLGGVIALTVVLAQPSASFELRGTIVP
jgi:hypothetical protein